MKNFNFKKIFKVLKNSIENIGSSPDKDWKILLVTFFILFIASVVFHIGLFIDTKKIDFSRSKVIKTQNSQNVNTDMLENVIDKYDGRGVSYKAIASSTNIMFDPAR
jgi:hypothetical protein